MLPDDGVNSETLLQLFNKIVFKKEKAFWSLLVYYIYILNEA